MTIVYIIYNYYSFFFFSNKTIKYLNKNKRWGYPFKLPLQIPKGMLKFS